VFSNIAQGQHIHRVSIYTICCGFWR